MMHPNDSVQSILTHIEGQLVGLSGKADDTAFVMVRCRDGQLRIYVTYEDNLKVTYCPHQYLPDLRFDEWALQ